MFGLGKILKLFVGDKSKKDLKEISPIIDEINSFEDEVKALNNDELRTQTLDFKKKINSSISDINIESIQAIISASPEQNYYLNTSPEFFMKRMLASGYKDIFQICKVFRDDEIGKLHLPEFTMIEWYRLDFNLSKIHNSNYYEPEKIPTVIGTQPFIAPEIYEGYYCKSSDMYSLGCILHLIYTRKHFLNQKLHF